MTTFCRRIRKEAIFTKDEAMKYGLEKACILYEIRNSLEGMPKEELYEEFPFIKKERFYELLEELLKDKILVLKVK